MEYNINTKQVEQIETKEVIEVEATQPVIEENPMVEFYFYGLIITIGFLVPLVFNLLKRLIKKLGFLNPKVEETLDKLKVKATESATKAGEKYINKKFNTNKKVPTTGVAVDIANQITKSIDKKFEDKKEKQSEEIKNKD